MGWYPQLSTAQLRFFQNIPKVELHRHLEGSLRLETLLDAARQYGIDIPAERIPALVQVQKGDCLDAANFLSKFQTLRQFYRSPEMIARAAREAVEDAALDNVRYMELRFTPMALARFQGYPLADVMDWVIEASREAAGRCGIGLRLIASVNRHEPVDLAERVIALAADRMDRGVVGVDLAGDEARFPARPFLGAFQEARRSGLHITLHAGEWGGAENVREAIEDFEAERVGHGVRVLEDPRAAALARERGTVFEVCVTSNCQSGVAPAVAAHPIGRMVSAGLKVTLNTDDPGISAITLSDEYRLALEDLGLPAAVLAEFALAAAGSAFLPPGERAALASTLGLNGSIPA